MAMIALEKVAEAGGFAGGPFGSNLVSKDYVDDGVPVVRGSNMAGHGALEGPFAYVSEEKYRRDLARNTATAGDIVFTQRGTLGQVVRIDDTESRTFVISQSQMRLRVDAARFDPKFVYYACRSEEFLRQIDDRAIRTGVPHINLQILRQLKIPILPLGAQRNVALVLNALDDKVAANRRGIELVMELGEALVRRRVADGSPKPLSELAEIVMGSSPKGEFLNEEGQGVRFYQGVRDFGAVFPEVRVSTTNPVRMAPRGATLLAVRAPVGEVNIATEDVCIGRGLASIFSAERPATIHFSLRAFQSIWDEYQGGGTVFASVNGKEVKATALLVPGDLSGELEGMLASLLERAVQAELENQRLAATRDELLPLLMSGKITVKDAEKTVEEVV